MFYVCPPTITHRLRSCVLVLALAAAAFGQGKTDTGIYVEPALPAIPAAGGKLTDPVFGTTIMRLTDANDGNPDCQVLYSYWPSFNLDSTYVLAQCVVSGREQTKIWRFDPNTFTRGAGFLLNVATPSGWGISPTDTIWSGKDPNILFGHPCNAQTINATNVTNGTNVMLKDLTSAIPAGATLQQMSKSADDNVFAFHIVDSSGGRYGYIAWRRDTDTIVLKQTSTIVDEVHVDKSGRYLTVVNSDGTDVVWDLNTGIATNLAYNSTDQGFFHYAAGTGSLLTAYWGTQYNSNALGFRPLSDPRVVTRLLSFSAGGQDMHYSMLAKDEGWGTISTFSTSGGGVQAPFQNEIFMVATDGSGRVRRLAHHRSVYNDYNDQPHASISMDGRYVAFTSNWGNADGRRDVFLLQVPGQVSAPTATLTASTSTVNAGQAATLTWSTTGATSVSITGIGTVAATGTISVSPTATTTYTLTASNSAGSATQSATITVAAPKPTASITASPASVTPGQTSTLTWSTSGASSVSISGVGTVAASGSVSVTPTGTTTYTLTATNSTGTTTQSTSVTVTSASTIQTPFSQYYEAEAAVLAAPMTRYSDTTASGGGYVTTTGMEAGTATFTVTVPSAGTYIIWGRVLVADPATDSFYVSVDGGTEDVYDAAETTWSSSWKWTKVNGRNGTGNAMALNPRTFVLSAGTHTIVVRGRETNARLDKIFVTNSGSAVPVDSTTPTVTTFSQYLEAESATLTAPMVKVNDTTASGGAYIYSTSQETGKAAFTITVPSAGTYVVWGRVLAPNSTVDSIYVSMDGGTEDVYDVAEGTWSNAWQWTKVNGRNGTSTPLKLNPRTFSLTAGTHTLTFRCREAKTKLDRIFVTNSLTLKP